METILTFVVSLIVALLFIPFASYQRERTARAFEGLISDAYKSRRMQADSSTPSPSETVQLLDPTQVRVLLAQALDVAYGFPSVVLTLVAFNSLTQAGDISAVILILVSVALTLGLAWLASPRNLAWYLRLQTGKRGEGRFGISYITTLLIIANAVGCAVAILQFVSE